MNEFTQAIFGLIKKMVGGSNYACYILHLWACFCILGAYLRNGSTLQLAALNTLVEPCINSVFLLFLHSIWRKLQNKIPDGFLFNGRQPELWYETITKLSELVS